MRPPKGEQALRLQPSIGGWIDDLSRQACVRLHGAGQGRQQRCNQQTHASTAVQLARLTASLCTSVLRKGERSEWDQMSA